MLRIDRHAQLLYCQLGRPGQIPLCPVTILSSLPWPLNDNIEASILHFSVSQKLFCPRMLQLFDGGVMHRPRLDHLQSSPTPRRKQVLLVLVPSVHLDFQHASMVNKNLETFLDASTPAPKPRFDLVETLLHQQEPMPIDPDYLYALIADMNNLLAHSVGLELLQKLPTSEWLVLHIDVTDDALIDVICAAVRALRATSSVVSLTFG